MKVLKLAFVGFGHAAQAFCELIISKTMDLNALGYSIKASVVITATKGNCYNPCGIELMDLMKDLKTDQKFSSPEVYLTHSTGEALICEGDYDVLIEVSPLNIFTGQPAISHIEWAMKRGKHVITANKGPIAWAYESLLALAQERGVHFLFETTVMDGAPVFNLYREALPLCQVLEINGILNTTTNFILDSMENGMSYDRALTIGRERGFVEADPSLDLDGFDAAAKLCALMNVMMNANIKPTDIDRTGIGSVNEHMILEAKKQDKKIKLMCHGALLKTGFYASVKPTMIPNSSLYATISGTSSVVSIKTDLMGELVLIEQDPEIEQTGYGLLSDLIALIKRLN